MTKRLNIITLVTKSYVDLLKEFFLETLPPEIDSLKIMYVNDFDNSRYNSQAKFLEKKRLEIIHNEIASHQGENLLFVDSDVVFVKGAKIVEEINRLLETNDLLFQFNDNWYNFGVFAVACNPSTEELFRYFLKHEIDKVKNSPDLHDQHLINALLGNSVDDTTVDQTFTHLKHTHLPLKYFGHHFREYKYPAKVPEGVVLFHATNTYSMPEKLQVMRHFKHRYYDTK